jgi:hypothetical protein
MCHIRRLNVKNQVPYVHLLYGFITQVLVYRFAALVITVIKLKIVN